MATTAIDKLKPVYLIYGPQKYLIDEAVDRLKKTLAAAGDVSLNFQKIRSPAAAGEIINACRTLPFMAPKRLVVVEDYDSLNPADKEELVGYINNPSPATVLVLSQSGVDNYGRVLVNKRSRLFKAAAKLKMTFEYKFDRRDSRRLIKEAFQRRGRQVSGEALEYLAEAAADDLWRLEGEVEKISLYAGEGREIDLSLIKEVASPTYEAELFDIIRAVTAGNKGEALRLLGRFWKRNEAAAGQLFFQLEKELRLLLRLKNLLAAGASDKEAAASLSVSPGRLYFLKKEVGRKSSRALTRAMRILLNSDFQRKTSQRPLRLIIETMSADIADVFKES